jgi:hypothetical protein
VGGAGLRRLTAPTLSAIEMSKYAAQASVSPKVVWSGNDVCCQPFPRPAEIIIAGLFVYLCPYTVHRAEAYLNCYYDYGITVLRCLGSTCIMPCPMFELPVCCKLIESLQFARSVNG